MQTYAPLGGSCADFSYIENTGEDVIKYIPSYIFFLAEKKGFEPLKPVKVYMISNHAPSTN